MSDELEWNHDIDDIPDDGLQTERTATLEEREAVARALDLLACHSLVVSYAIVPKSGGHFRLTGQLHARVEQSCVVTLEPLTNEIAEAFSVDYWPESELPDPSGGVVDVHEEADLEPIVGSHIKVGRVVFDALAAGIDLFPRKPGVTFEPPEGASETDDRERSGPFAALARIKSKR